MRYKVTWLGWSKVVACIKFRYILQDPLPMRALQLNLPSLNNVFTQVLNWCSNYSCLNMKQKELMHKKCFHNTQFSSFHSSCKYAVWYLSGNEIATQQKHDWYQSLIKKKSDILRAPVIKVSAWKMFFQIAQSRFPIQHYLQ